MRRAGAAVRGAARAGLLWSADGCAWSAAAGALAGQEVLDLAFERGAGAGLGAGGAGSRARAGARRTTAARPSRWSTRFADGPAYARLLVAPSDARRLYLAASGQGASPASTRWRASAGRRRHLDHARPGGGGDAAAARTRSRCWRWRPTIPRCCSSAWWTPTATRSGGATTAAGRCGGCSKGGPRDWMTGLAFGADAQDGVRRRRRDPGDRQRAARAPLRLPRRRPRPGAAASFGRANGPQLPLPARRRRQAVRLRPGRAGRRGLPGRRLERRGQELAARAAAGGARPGPRAACAPPAPRPRPGCATATAAAPRGRAGASEPPTPPRRRAAGPGTAREAPRGLRVCCEGAAAAAGARWPDRRRAPRPAAQGLFWRWRWRLRQRRRRRRARIGAGSASRTLSQTGEGE